MVQIIGKYEKVASENLAGYVMAVGIFPTAETATAFAETKPTLEFTQAGDKWSLTAAGEGKSSKTTFTLGTPYDEMMPHGAVLKSVTTREGNTLTTVTDLPDGNQSVRVYEFTDSGINIHLADKKTGVKGSYTYKRV